MIMKTLKYNSKFVLFSPNQKPPQNHIKNSTFKCYTFQCDPIFLDTIFVANHEGEREKQ